MAEKVETEIKLRVGDPGAARTAVEALGARLARPRHFEDNLLLDDARGDFGAAGKALRLRRAEGAGGADLQGAAPGRRRREKPAARSRRRCPTRDLLESILGGLGYRTMFRYQKYRETWTWKGVEIVIDETPLGAFLEIEGEEPAIREAAAALGYGPADFLTQSYSTLYVLAGGTGDMVFP